MPLQLPHRHPSGAGSPAGSAPWRSRTARLRLCRLLLFLLLGTAVLTACDRTPEPASAPAVEPRNLFTLRAPPSVPAVRRLLVVGDSLSISLGEQLERTLTGAPGLDYAWNGTKSTGLTRPDLLNWPQHLRELIARQPPDIVVIMLGANDVMPLDAPNGNHVQFGDPDWAMAYAAKARELTTICRHANPNVTIYWVGVPSMGDRALADGVRQVNAALQAMCRQDGCHFIDTHAAFSDQDDHFGRHARDAATGEVVTIRTADGVHLTENGAAMLAGVVLAPVAAGEKLPMTAGMHELLTTSQDLTVVPDAAVPASPAAHPPVKVAKGRVHTVRAGETFAIIAKRLHLPEEDLRAVNPGVNPRSLSIGQKLRLPRRR